MFLKLTRVGAALVGIVGATALAAGSAPPTSSAASAADTRPPSVPQGMAFSGKTATTVSLVWRASSDNVRVTGYRLYKNGTRVATVKRLRYTFRGLRCATRYTFALEAVDAAGNPSYRAEATGSISTNPCRKAQSPKKPAPPRKTKRAAPKGSAHLWIDTDGGSCRRTATPGAYVNGQACRSLQVAYNAAKSGDTVNIVDGTYGGQTLAAGTKAVTFRAAGSGRPSFGHFVSAAQNITVRGILIEDRAEQNGTCKSSQWGVLVPCGANQTYDNIVVDGLNTGEKLGIENPGDAFKLKNSEIRNIRDQKGFQGGADDMVIENNYWHHITVRTDGVHNECMYIIGGDRSVYRGNLFIGCPTMALFFTNWNGGPAYRDVVVENNVFGHTLDDNGRWHGSCAFKIGWGYNEQNTVHGWIVRYNTFETSPCNDGTRASGDNAAGQWYGNLGGIDCAPEWVYHHNVGGTCGGSNSVVIRSSTNSAAGPNQAPFYVNAPAGDFRLKAGTVAIDRGDPKAHPSIDKTRKKRPVGRAPDAGAYEFRP